MIRFNDSDVKIIRPCEDTPGLYVAEVYLNINLKLDEIYIKLMNITDFRYITYSKLLNLIYIVMNDKTIHIYKNGKIVIRRVKNEEDAKETIRCIKDRYNLDLI